MNTKEAIKKRALELFNDQGMLNVTLRDVAAQLKKSYGNITYHYKTKEHVIDELYTDMVEELKVISVQIFDGGDIFNSIVKAPALTFDLSLKYLFLFKDFVEIKRGYPKLAGKIDKSNAARKSQLKQALIILQKQDFLRDDLANDDLDYLMELSGAVRTFFFLNLSEKGYKKVGLKKIYVDYVNKLLQPYLTIKGRLRYKTLL
jgi:AcrR family transcriptional regulator